MSVAYSIPGIYNALDTLPSSVNGMLLTNTASDNATALQYWIDTAQGQGGGIVIIPATDSTLMAGSYLLAEIDIPAAASQPLLICGTGLGTALIVQSSVSYLFKVNSAEVIFQDLKVLFDQSAGFVSGTAFYFENQQFQGLFRVQVTDCENAVEFNGDDQGYMLECTIDYESFPDNKAAVGVTLNAGTEIMIAQCVLSYNTGVLNTIGTTGISITKSVYTRITDTVILEFDTGILLDAQGNLSKSSSFTSVEITALVNCVSVQHDVYDLNFAACHFQASTNYSGASDGIVVGSSSAHTNDGYDTIRFDSCSVTGFNAGGYGLRIYAGKNIQVVGGYYAGNGNAGIGLTSGASVTPAEIQIIGSNCVGPDQGGTAQIYGIYITSGQDIQINSVNCSGTGTSSTHGAGVYISGSGVSNVRISGAIFAGVLGSAASEQQYGISLTSGATGIHINDSTVSGATTYGVYLNAVTDVFLENCDIGNNPYGLAVTGSCENVFVDGCNFNGYATGALYTSSPGTLQIINSPGYNDQGTVVSTLAPTSGTSFNSVTFGYYGPIAFYAANATSVTITQISINGNNTHVLSGEFTLGPPAPNGASYIGDYAIITYTGTAPHPNFFAVGR